jgi:hypothetical protein
MPLYGRNPCSAALLSGPVLMPEHGTWKRPYAGRMGARRGTAAAAVAVLLLAGCAQSPQEQPSDTPGSTGSATTAPSEPPSPTAAPSQSTTATPAGSATAPEPVGPSSQPPRSATPATPATPAAPQTPAASGGTAEPTPKAPREIVGTVEEALAAWLADEGVEYAGPCEGTELPDDVGRYCSRVVEERETAVVVMIGPTFSEFTVYLLIERTDRGWTVVRSADVPGPGEPDPGLPF